MPILFARRALALALCVFAVARPAVAVADRIENPVYKNWAGFKPGTSVVYRSTSLVGASRFESTYAYTLIELTADKAVVEMQVTVDSAGKRTKNRPMRLENPRALALPPGTRPEAFGKAEGMTEQGEEVVKVAGKDYKAKWYKAKGKSDLGETFTHAWSSDEVPGGLVKSVNTTPANKSSMTMELVEVKLP